MARHLLIAAATMFLWPVKSLPAIAASGLTPASELPIPLGSSRAQVELGDRVFHGMAAGGNCSKCHGADAKGTAFANDLTLGMYIWGDGSVRDLKRTILHNMEVAPGMDGRLTAADVDAVAAYVWAIGHDKTPNN